MTRDAFEKGTDHAILDEEVVDDWHEVVRRQRWIGQTQNSVKSAVVKHVPDLSCDFAKTLSKNEGA